MDVQLKGWKAVAVLAAFLGFALYTRGNAQRTLETEAVDVIRPWLVARYSAPIVDEMQAKPVAQMSEAEAGAYVQRVTGAGRVEIKSIQAKGMGDDIICRVEILVDGQPPPDGRSVRYYRMNYSNLIGWTMGLETGEWAWRMKLW